MSRPLLIFDGHCGFCRMWIDYWKQLTSDRVDYAPSQEVRDQYPQIPREAFSKSVQLVRPDATEPGERSVASGARAVFETLGKERLYESVPLLAPATEAAYRFIAAHRDLAYWVTRLTFGRRIEVARFAKTQWLFLRLLAVVYAIAFASLGVQVRPLAGSEGVAPAAEFLTRVAESLGSSRFLALPTLFWLNADDKVLVGACWLGFALAIALLFGRLERLLLASLYVLYLSLALVGQPFLLFQWDALLLEAGFLAIFFGRTPATQRVIAWLYRLLVFRLFFLSGWVKLASGDPSWRNLTALDFHYWTQPLPNPVSWSAAKLPEWFQHASTAMVLGIELVAPFLIFMPRLWRLAGAWAMLGLQALIFLTGNYTFFNILTAALVLFLFDDQALRRFVKRGREPCPDAAWSRRAVLALAAVIVGLGIVPLWRAVSPPAPAPLEAAAGFAVPFQIVNSYGLFAVMTTTRPEIVLEGSRDGETWTPYEFRYKTGDVNRAPPFVAPHQPRLDWQMWFAALDDYRYNPWLLRLAERLIVGEAAVQAFFTDNPFPGDPPRYVRARVYSYRFTSFEERSQTGAWWTRELLGDYFPPVGLQPVPEDPAGR